MKIKIKKLTYKDISKQYRDLTKNIEKVAKYQESIDDRICDFEKTIEQLFNSLLDTVQRNQIGLQNVYDEIIKKKK